MSAAVALGAVGAVALPAHAAPPPDAVHAPPQVSAGGALHRAGTGKGVTVALIDTPTASPAPPPATDAARRADGTVDATGERTAPWGHVVLFAGGLVAVGLVTALIARRRGDPQSPGETPTAPR